MGGSDCEKIPAALKEALKAENVRDLQIKMHRIKNVPIEEQCRVFCELVEYGFDAYIKSEQKRFPEKTPKEIMLEYYKKQNRRKGL